MKYIFVTGMGRSGTTFLARMLGQIPTAVVRHEAIGDRDFWLLSWYLTGEYTVPFLERTRRSIEAAHNAAYYIDVNAYLQHAVPELQKVFAPECVFHLVRDPRAVVRSIYSRRAESRLNVLPKARPEIEKWLDGDKFSRICWNWAETTTRLVGQQTRLIRFERLIADYGYFRDELLAPFGFELNETQWRTRAGVRENPTRSAAYRFLYALAKRKPFVGEELPPYKQWSEPHKAVFAEICGPAMKLVGYEL